MKLLSLLVLCIFVSAMMVAGCTSPQPATPPATPAAPATPVPAPAAPVSPQTPPQLAGDWTLTTMGVQGGTAVTYPTTAISLTMNQDGTLTGYDGCNNYFGSFALTGVTTPKGQGMTISGISASKKYCATLADQEQQYLNILGKTMAYVVDGTQLTLTGNKGDVLVYQRPATLVARTAAPEPV